MIRLKRKEPPQLAEPGTSFKTGVFVSKSAVYLFPDTSEVIKVWWKIDKRDNCLDWIGLFDTHDSSFYLDQKSLRHNVSPAIFTLTPRNVLTASSVYFGLIDGMTGRMLARSANVEICKTASLVIHDIEKPKNVRVYLNTSQGATEIPRRSRVTFQHGFTQEKTEKADEHENCFEIDFETEDVHFSVLAEPESQCFDHFIAGRQLRNEFVESKSYSHHHIIDIVFSVRPLIYREDRMDTASSSSSSSSSTTSSESAWTTYVDVKKRKFYVNHETKETRWTRPPDVLNNNVVRIAETATRPQRAATTPTAFSTFITPRRTVTTSSHHHQPHKTDLAHFLRRDEFRTTLYENAEAMRVYNECTVVRHALHRIQHAMDAPDKFENQPLFVRFVNAFADRTQPLPTGWQSIDMDGRTVFLDHATKSTCLFDPRVRHLDTKPTPSSSSTMSRRGHSVPVTRSAKRNAAKPDPDGLIAKCDELRKIARENFPHIAERISQKLMLIERFGGLAVASLANDMDITLALSMLEMSKRAASEQQQQEHRLDEPDDATIRAFYEKLNRLKLGKGPHRLCWKVSRDRLLDDAFRVVLGVDANLVRRARLQIRFDGELALDYGGLSREFFILLSRELFDPRNGYFEYAGVDYHLQLRPRDGHGHCHESTTDRDTQWLRLAGRILALAILHRCLVDVFFTDVFYKCLQKAAVELDDFRHSDPDFHRSMTWIRENDIDALEMSFVYNQMTDGRVAEKELVAGGETMRVDNSNKHRFIELMCQKKAVRGIEQPIDTLLGAFHQVLPVELLAELRPCDLKRMLSGSLELNLNDWRANTVYKGGYSDTHIVIEWFWEVIETMTNQERFDLLLFVTGSSSVPFEGFSALRGNDETSKFCVEKWGDATSLPRAHTCFNRLQLPSYGTRPALRLKLQQAIQNGMSYSIE